VVTVTRLAVCQTTASPSVIVSSNLAVSPSRELTIPAVAAAETADAADAAAGWRPCIRFDFSINERAVRCADRIGDGLKSVSLPEIRRPMNVDRILTRKCADVTVQACVRFYAEWRTDAGPNFRKSVRLRGAGALSVRPLCIDVAAHHRVLSRNGNECHEVTRRRDELSSPSHRCRAIENFLIDAVSGKYATPEEFTSRIRLDDICCMVQNFTRATLASASISCHRVLVCLSVYHKSVFY